MTDSHPGLLKVIATGLDSASVRLGKLSGARWEMQTLSVRQFDSEEYKISYSDRDQEEGFGVLFTVTGATFVVFFPSSSAAPICRAFMGASYTPTREMLAMGEIANIVVDGVSDAIGEALGDVLILTAPRTVEGTRADVMRRALASFSTEGNPRPIVGQIHMMAEQLSADCTLILLMTSAVRGRVEKAAAKP